MATIVTRSGKGSPLSIAEGDANFTNLNNDKIELDDISVTTAAGAETAALSYNNTTGVLTFTPVTTGDLIAEIVEDTTPQLGGNLDVQSSSITTSTTNGNITLTPNGTGLVVVDGALRVTNGTDGNISVDTVNGNLNLSSGTGTGAVNIQSDIGLNIAGDGTDAQIFTATTNSNLTLFANGTGAIICDSNVDIGANTITNGNTNGDVNLASSGTGSVAITGGTGLNLKAANNIFTNTAATDLEFTSTGYLNMNNMVYFAAGIEEEVYASTTTSGTYAPNPTNGSIHYVALSGNMTINGLSSAVAGQTVTLFFDGSGGSYTLTLGASVLSPGGSLALTSGGYDIVTITCIDDATPVYVATAVNNFQ